MWVEPLYAETEMICLYHVKTQQEGSHLQARRRVLTRNRIDLHLDLGFPRLQNVRHKFLFFKPPRWWNFMIAVQAKICPMKNVEWLPKDASRGSTELLSSADVYLDCHPTLLQSDNYSMGRLTNHPGLPRTKGTEEVWGCKTLGAKSVGVNFPMGGNCWHRSAE